MIDKELASKEKVLERLKVDDEIESQRLSISQKKALEHEAKQKYGKDWKKVLGVVKSLKVDKDTLQTLHSMGISGDELRSLAKPKRVGRYR